MALAAGTVELEGVPGTAMEPALGTDGCLPHELKLVAGGGTEGNDLCGDTPEGFGGVVGAEVWSTGAEYDNAFLVGWQGGSGGAGVRRPPCPAPSGTPLGPLGLPGPPGP